MGTHSKAVRAVIGVVAALAIVGASCTSDADDDDAAPDGPRTEGAVFGVSSSAPTLLRSAQSCDDVVEGFRSLAVENVAAGVPFGRIGFDMTTTAQEDAADSSAADGAAAAPTAGGESSDTNTQEAGIDEPDIVETDGDHVYVIDQSGDSERLVILDGASAAVLSRVDLASWGNTMLLSGDRLLVISGGGYGFAEPFVVEDGAADDAAAAEVTTTTRAVDADGDGVDGSSPAEPGDDTPAETPPTEPPEPEPITTEPEPTVPPIDLPTPVEPPEFQAGTTLQLFDVSDPAAPELIEATEVEGSHTSTRVVDGVARVVISSYPQVYPTETVDFSDAAAVEEATKEAVDEAELSDWLPSFRTSTPDDDGGVTTTDGELVECDQVLLPDVNAGSGETSILRVDFDSGFDPSATTTVVADAHTVYASAQTLYIAATRAVPTDGPGSDDRTEPAIDIAPEDWSTAIHAFDLTGGGAAAHAAAGEVPGNLLNQYSLSEYDGHLRVATTEGAPWGPDPDSQSGVRILRRDGNVLTEIGSVTGLGVTETIQSVRFMGETGYVVTFRQTDPLYVIDLSDPTDPVAVGELKIPGFSSYLHPIAEGRLIGIGRDADPETGQDRGFLVSLFDVSDPTAPAQIQTFTDPTMHSPAGSDPKAFLWWEAEGAVVVPYERYDERAFEEAEATGEFIEPDFDTGIMVLDVSDGGISERGAIRTTSGPDGYTSWSRGLVVQDELWGIYAGWTESGSTGGVAVADFDDLGSPTFVPFG